MDPNLEKLSPSLSIERSGLWSVGHGVIDSGIGATLIAVAIEIGIWPERLGGTQTVVFCGAVLSVIVKFLRKVLIRYKIVE